LKGIIGGGYNRILRGITEATIYFEKVLYKIMNSRLNQPYNLLNFVAMHKTKEMRARVQQPQELNFPSPSSPHENVQLKVKGVPETLLRKRRN